MTQFSYSDTEIKVLKNFASINPSMIILPDKFAVVNGLKKSVVAYYNFETPYQYNPYGIFDLDEFLTTIGSMSECQLEVEEGIVTISDDRNNIKSRYNTSPMDMLPEVKDVTRKFEQVPIQMEFKFTSEKIAILKKVTNILKHERIYFESTDDGIRIIAAQKSLANKTNPTELMITGELLIKNELDRNTVLYLNLDELNILDGDYHVKISDAQISHWHNEFLNVDYYIGVNKFTE